MYSKSVVHATYNFHDSNEAAISLLLLPPLSPAQQPFFHLAQVEGCRANVVTFNTQIDVYGKLGRWQDAVGVLEMLNIQVCPRCDCDCLLLALPAVPPAARLHSCQLESLAGSPKDLQADAVLSEACHMPHHAGVRA